MSLDFQQVRAQVKMLGEKAPSRAMLLQERREQALAMLEGNANELERLRRKVEEVVASYEPNLRCAAPISEALTAHFSLPGLPEQVTILAADGSQISPDRHSQVDYCLINTGGIQMRFGCPEPPTTIVKSKLMYDEELYTATGTITEERLGTMRDLNERDLLAELAREAPPPVISFTDGPMELWGGSEGESANFRESLKTYQGILSRLYELGVATAGYVDKPGANLVVRLLEVVMTPQNELAEIRKKHPLRGVTDIELFKGLLGPGERSAVFAMQSYSAKNYGGVLKLHFFYLNVGRPGHPWLARVEIPGWVADNPAMLDSLHAVLASQSRIMGAKPYPYLLHRAHEAAVVSLQEKEQVTQMIVMELRRRGVAVGEISNKQAAKNLSGRTRM